MTIVLALLLGAFVVLLWLVQLGGPVVVLDGLVQAGLASLRQRPVLMMFSWLTQAGTGATGAVVLLAASGLMASSGRGAIILPMWAAFLGAEATTWSIKFLTARVRPPFLEGLTAASPSFPSAHSTVAVVVYGFIAMVVVISAPDRFRPEILATATVLIALISFSRLVLSLHYLSDVVGGILVGAFWLIAAWRWVHWG